MGNEGTPLWSYNKGTPLWSYNKTIPLWSYNKGIPLWSCSKGIPLWSYSKGIPLWSYNKGIPLWSYDKGIPLWPYRQLHVSTLVPASKQDPGDTIFGWGTAAETKVEVQQLGIVKRAHQYVAPQSRTVLSLQHKHFQPAQVCTSVVLLTMLTLPHTKPFLTPLPHTFPHT